MRRLRPFAVLAAATLSLGLAACGGSSGNDSASSGSNAVPTTQPSFEAGSTMQKLADKGSVTVGTKFDQPLFGEKGLSGKPEGFDVEVAKLIAANLGIKPDDVKFVETVSANREPFLQQKQVDYVVATYTINDKRDQVVDFAGPYFEAGQDILVKKGNPKGIKGPDDLAGKKVCSVSGSTPASTIQTKYPQAQLVLFDAYTKCRDALQNGQVDAVTTDNVILSGYVSKSPDEFELVGKPFTQEPYGIGIPEGEEDFCNWVNDTLQAAAKDGTLQAAFDKTAGKYLDKKVTPLPEPHGCDS